MRALTVGLILLLLTDVVHAQESGTISATGFITDTLCGAKGANAKHVDCAKRTVALLLCTR